MDLSPEVKVDILTNRGLSPDEYDITPTGSVVKKKALVQPSTGADSLPIAPDKSTTIGQAVGYHAAASVVPTGVGIGTGYLGGLAGGALLGGAEGSVVPGLGNIIGALIGGGIGAYGASKLQSKLLPDAANQALATTQEEHPVASTLGEFLPQAVVFNPIEGLKSLPKTLGAAGKVVTRGLPGSLTGIRSALTGREAQLLGNTALNVGIGGGQDVASQLSGDEPFNLPQLLTTIGASALLSHPTKLGKRLGFHDVLPNDVRPPKTETKGESTIPAGESYTGDFNEAGPMPFHATDEKGKYSVPDKTVNDIFAREFPELAKTDFIAGQGVNEPNQTVKLTTEQKREMLAAKQQEKFGGEKDASGQFDTTIQPRTERDKAFDTGMMEKNAQDLEEQRRAKSELDRQEAAHLASENAARAMELQNKLRENQAKSSTLRTAPVTTELGKEIHPDYTGTVEHDNTVIQQVPETEAERIQREYDDAKFSSESQPESTIFGQDLIPEQRQRIIEQQRLQAENRGIPVKVQPEVTKTTGEPVAGATRPGTREVEVSSSKGGLDTTPHEAAGHRFLEDLSKSTNLADRAFAKKVLSIVPDEETLARAVGTKLAKRNFTELYGTKRQKFNQWWDDVKNHLAERTGSKDPEVLMGRLMATYKHAAPYGTRLEAFPHLQVRGNTGNQREAEVPKTGDTPATSASPSFSEDPTIIASKLGLKFDSTPQSGGAKLDGLPEELKAQLPKQWSFEPTEGAYKGHTFYVPEGSSLDSVKQRMEEKFGKAKYSEEPAVKREENFGPAIESKLGEASFKAAKEAEKETRNRRQAEDLQGEKINPTQAEREAHDKVNQKSNELEAFTRPDVERHSEEPAIDSKTRVFPWSAQHDKMRALDEKVGHAADKMELDKDVYEGRLVHEPTANILSAKPTDQELANVRDYARDMFRHGSSEVELTPREAKLRDILQPAMKYAAEERVKHGLEVETSSGKFRKGSVSDYYLPDSLSDKAIEMFTRKVHTPEATAAREEWAQYVADESKGKITKADALENINHYINSIGGNAAHSVEFNALRKAQGYGVPESLREQNLLKIVSKYGRRAATDLAYWKNLQSDPYVSARLGLSNRRGELSTMDGVTSIGSHVDAQGTLRSLFGDFSTRHNPKFTSTVRAVTNGLLGTATGIRNTAQLPALISPYMSSFKDFKAFFSAFQHLSDAKKASITYGARSGTMDLDRWHTLESPDKYTETMNKFGEVLRKYSGRDLMEQSDRIYTFAVGKELAKVKVADALAGDVKAKKWLDTMGLGLEDVKPSMEDDYLNRVAKNVADKVQGTYDGRGLPVGVFDSQYAPFFALGRWSIEKTNTLWKDVITPAAKGENYLPLLTYTLGTVLSGTAIRQLNQLMTGKKDYTPSIGEAVSEGNKQYTVAALVNLMQQGSYMGIAGDTVKSLSDVFIQHEYPRGPVSFPAADFLTDTVGHNLANWMSAMQSGQGGVETTLGLVGNILKSSLQNYRILDSRLIHPDDTERQNKYRDYRTFKKLEGEDVPALGAMQGNPLDNKDLKKFKETQDIGEGVGLLPGLISQAIEKAAGDPYKLKRELNKIKENNYETMPGIETAPLELARYMSFLAKTQGPDEASQRLTDYMTHNLVNKAKGEMVPSL